MGDEPGDGRHGRENPGAGIDEGDEGSWFVLPKPHQGAQCSQGEIQHLQSCSFLDQINNARRNPSLRRQKKRRF